MSWHFTPNRYFNLRAEECVAATNKKPQGSAVTLIWKLTNILFSLSKFQKSLEERNHFSKIPIIVKSLLGYWQDNSHKKISVGQIGLGSLINSIQETTSKSGMSTGGFLSDLRGGLLHCLPVLEKHGDYLRSMSQRKQIQRGREITNAADTVVRDISDREKISLVEIGEKEVTCKEVKQIVDSLEGKEFYEPTNISVLLPEDRKRRFKVLNQFLLQQSPLKLCLWTFDNHGVAPQSVFGFLIRLEDDNNTVLKTVMELRPKLLAEQKIYYPREFLQQMKYFSSTIVDLSSAPVRILMDMVLGNSRATESRISKLVEERVLDAILSDDEELATDMRAFNGRESQYLSFLAVVRDTLSQFLAEDKNRWQSEYNGTVVSNLSMSCSLPSLFRQCVENALKKDPGMPIPTSEKYLSRYLYPRTAAAAAAVSTSEPLIPLRWAVQQKVLEKPNPDSYYNMSQYKSLKTLAVSLGNDLVTMVSTDDKAGIDIGEPNMPLVACQHPGKSWIPNVLKLGEGQHSFHKFNLTPSVRLLHELPSNVDGSFYRGKPQLTVKDAVFEPSSGARHFTELKQTLDANPSDKKPVTIITNDGGPDHNIHHDRNKAALLALFLSCPHILYLANFQMAANRSSFHPVEKLNCILNLALNGVALVRDKIEDPVFEDFLNSCSSMVDIRQKAEHNPGLVEQVVSCLKSSKEIVEERAKKASLKENFFNVFDAAREEEIKEFMKVLKKVDDSFRVSDYLDKKKKFHLTGALLEYYKEVSTETYYCITMERHKNMSSDFLNSLYENMNLPLDLHPIPCPVRDPENPEKYLRFEDLYFKNSLRRYDDRERPGKIEKKSHNIPFPKSLVRAQYCKEITMICVGCRKRRVVYSHYKPDSGKIEQARYLLENMRYECGYRLCSFGTEGVATVVEVRAADREMEDRRDTEEDDTDSDEMSGGRDSEEADSTDLGNPIRILDENSDVTADTNSNKISDPKNSPEMELLGNQSIFSVFFIDESLNCSSPMEKHLYEIVPPSLTTSLPCYYCGEDDLVRTAVDSENTYPLCIHCRTVRKLGPVQRRKKRTIVPRATKKKNKKGVKPSGSGDAEQLNEDVEVPTNEAEEDSTHADVPNADIFGEFSNQKRRKRTPVTRIKKNAAKKRAKTDFIEFGESDPTTDEEQEAEDLIARFNRSAFSRSRKSIFKESLETDFSEFGDSDPEEGGKGDPIPSDLDTEEQVAVDVTTEDNISTSGSETEIPVEELIDGSD